MTSPSATGQAEPVTLRSYMIGLVAALVLTGVAFAVVLFGQSLPRSAIILTISIAACVQVFVHLRYFLHIDLSQVQRWNLLTLLFTILIIIIFVAGTIWVISDLNYRMM